MAERTLDWTWLWHSTSWACLPIMWPTPLRSGGRRNLLCPHEGLLWLMQAMQVQPSSCQPNLCTGDPWGAGVRCEVEWEAVAVAATRETPPTQPALCVDDGPQVGIFTFFHR